MAEQIQQTRRVNSDGTASVETTEVVDTGNDVARKDSIASRIVWFIAGVIAALLAFRFVFVLLGANSSNGFADFIYTVSHPFAAPFFGIFGYTQTYGEAKFEFSTLLAIVVYLLVAYGISKLLTIRQPR
ncbi:hypothetical protein BH09PAT3_BH09PAT3_6690 [soil metagenome]